MIITLEFLRKTAEYQPSLVFFISGRNETPGQFLPEHARSNLKSCLIWCLFAVKIKLFDQIFFVLCYHLAKT